MKKILYLILLLPAFSYGQEVSLAAKIAAYRKAGDWRLWADSINWVIKQFPPKPYGKDFGAKTGIIFVDPNDDWNLNAAAWDAFQYCDDKAVLKSALKWSELSIRVNPDSTKDGPIAIYQYLDTKANLLYKLGKVHKAIKIELTDYQIMKVYLAKEGKAINDSTEASVITLNKMRSGKHTW